MRYCSSLSAIGSIDIRKVDMFGSIGSVDTRERRHLVGSVRSIYVSHRVVEPGWFVGAEGFGSIGSVPCSVRSVFGLTPCGGQA